MGEAQRAGEEPCGAGAAEPGQGQSAAPSAAGKHGTGGHRGHAWGNLGQPGGLSPCQDEAALRGELVRHGV